MVPWKKCLSHVLRCACKSDGQKAVNSVIKITLSIFVELPRLPEDTDVIIIRKDAVDMSGHVDFMVRREKVKAALEYMIANDSDYADLTINEEALQQLPEHGSLPVAHRLPNCREGRQNGSGAAMPVGPDATTGENSDNEDDDL